MLWLDVGDLFGYAGVFLRPSGIQRVVYELGHALAAGPDIGFVRHGAGDGFVPVSWPTIAALYARLTEHGGQTAPTQPVSAWTRAAGLQMRAWQAMAAIPPSLSPRQAARAEMGDGDSGVMAAGDTLLVAGAGWSDLRHAARVAAAKARHGVRVALLVHDIIPLRRPEWFDPAHAARFRDWLDPMLDVADRVMAVSACTAADVARHEVRRGRPARTIDVIRLGDGFSPAGPGAAAISGRYALYVSTLEVRKNHVLLLDVWRTLLERLPEAAVPTLVFAGREGALTGDLMRQLRASDRLGGKIVLRHALGDADIAALYRGCAFTLFPSLYEGWGLPVSESLAFGRPCLAAATSSVPEAGGALARYFDPLDTPGTVAVVEALLQDEAGLAAWQAEIVAGFRPTPWSHTAEMVRAVIA